MNLLESKLEAFARLLSTMKQILVTGGAGFLGSHLIEKLILKDSKVYCLDNFYTGSQRNIQHLLDNQNFRDRKSVV